MSDQPDEKRQGLSDAEQTHIEQVCERFLGAWKSGERPRIEEFLATESPTCRDALLTRLLEQEVAWRIQAGETPTEEEYAQRFSADAQVVSDVFSRRPQQASPSIDATLSVKDAPPTETLPIPDAALAETQTRAAEATADKEPGDSDAPEHVGRYRVIRILGRGGFGNVYLARDEELEREVAIKVLRRDRFSGDAEVQRLLEEAQHVARLDKHPGIVGVYDVGRQEDGSVFVVLQYIEGQTLGRELKSHKLSTVRIWEIMLQVTAAIQHAHAAGLVHRDLKPANILLDADGNAHVLDFGLAFDDQNQRLRVGEISGTPAYMAPEQVRGDAHRLDGRADVWAIGVMLYEMLTRRRPFHGHTHQEVFDDILHREPKPPRQLSPEIPADLERICLKCLSKDISDRYLTAADLTKDLRHTREAPQRRKKRNINLVLATVFALVIGAGIWGFWATRREQPVITIAPSSALKVRRRATLRGHTDALWTVAFSADDRTLASAGVDMEIKLWDVRGGYETHQLTGHRGEIRCVAFGPDGQTLASAGNDRSIIVWNLQTGELLRQITGHTGDVRSVIYLPTGKTLVSGSVDKTIRFWDLDSGNETSNLATHRAAIHCVTCTKDGAMLASSGDGQTVQLHRIATGELLHTLAGHSDGVTQIAFSPDGQRLASASWDKTIRVWDVASGDSLLVVDKLDSAFRSIVYSPTGRRLAIGGEDGSIRLLDAKTGAREAVIRGHTGPVTSVAFSSDGRILASASGDRTVMMWELEEAPEESVDPPKKIASGRIEIDTTPTDVGPGVATPDVGAEPTTPTVDPVTDASPSEPAAGTSPTTPVSEGTANTEPMGTPDTVTTVIQEPPVQPEPEEWVEIEFEEKLLGWKAYGVGTWSLEDEGVVKGEGSGGWLGTDADYEDVELKLEFRIGKDSNSGVFLRAWPEGPPNGEDFIEIQLLDDTSSQFTGLSANLRTAAIYKNAAPSPQIRCEPDTWHAMQIRAAGPRIQVQYEGQTVVDTDLDQTDIEIPGHKRKSGRIGLQTLRGTVEFRNIAIRRLEKPQSAASPPPIAIAPFDAEQAKKHQQAWADYLGVPVEMEDSIGMKFVLIPPGEFDMGSTKEEIAQLLESANATNQPSWYIGRLPSEAPKHHVRITKPFWLGRCEVTRGQFRRFVDDRGYQTEAERDGKGGYGNVDGQWIQDPRFVWNRDWGFEQADDHPVANVTWNDVTAFCQWLSEKEGVPSSLPTEGQWEYACRAGATTPWYSGEDEISLRDHAWFDPKSDAQMHLVGQLQPNAWGLYDMHGNVMEWSSDWYGEDYYGKSPENDPKGPPTATGRVDRGGSWRNTAGYCRSAFRSRHAPGNRSSRLGFRVARGLSSE